MNYGTSAADCYTNGMFAKNMNCAAMDAAPCGGGHYSVTQHQACVKYLDSVACGTQISLSQPPCNQCS
jgi:hypothetical protein